MGADISRIRWNPLLDYAGVELKQGGVVLDSDFNEHVANDDRVVSVMLTVRDGMTLVQKRQR